MRYEKFECVTLKRRVFICAHQRGNVLNVKCDVSHCRQVLEILLLGENGDYFAAMMTDSTYCVSHMSVCECCGWVVIIRGSCGAGLNNRRGCAGCDAR
jgi:hypothetical protein